MHRMDRNRRGTPPSAASANTSMTVESPRVMQPLQGGEGHRPFNIDIPHAGRIYPADLEIHCSQRSLIMTEDRYADVFYGPLTQIAHRWLQAPYARGYINVNG